MNKYEDLEIRDYEDFDAFFEDFELDCGGCSFEKYRHISVYGGREFIYAALMEFMGPDFIDRYEVGSIDFVSRDVYGADYDEEYCLFVNEDGLISVDFARDQETGDPYSICEEVAYIYQDDCQQDIVEKALDGNDCYAILFGCDGEDSEAGNADEVTGLADKPTAQYDGIADKLAGILLRVNNLEHAVSDLIVDIAKSQQA